MVDIMCQAQEDMGDHIVTYDSLARHFRFQVYAPFPVAGFPFECAFSESGTYFEWPEKENYQSRL
jgi:hypothetical protein